MSNLSNDQSKRRITLQLPNDVIAWIDTFRAEWGLRSRGPTVERLLRELFVDLQTEEDSESPELAIDAAQQQPSPMPKASIDLNDRFDEAGALVLVAPSEGGALGFDFEPDARVPQRPSRSSVGIDLPGFVRKQSEQLKRAVSPQPPVDPGRRDTFAVVDSSAIDQAIAVAKTHWLDLYGSAPNDHVLEAAMQWIAAEIWPHVDQSDGRPFTWSLASGITAELAPSWQAGEPCFEQVMVMAGLLEDPYSASTLSLRIPTLIRRFVHRFRRRRRGMSFETLENTMSLHGALKLLQLPTTPGHRLTLADIREAYRDQALRHHPDSGGSAEQMRRLNEAYQMLKELYRSA